MNQPTQSSITQMLSRHHDGQPDQLYDIVAAAYEELAHIGHRLMRGERQHHTLQTRALVHEAYLRVIKLEDIRWQNRQHFFSTWAGVMRRVLVDHARAKNAEKRQCNQQHTVQGEIACFGSEDSDILALNEALTRLSDIDPMQGAVVELRYFGGLSVEETALALNTSAATVKRKWTVARAWLYRELSGQDDVA